MPHGIVAKFSLGIETVKEINFIYILINNLRIAAHGEKVQIGQYYDHKTKKIVWAYPRLFSGTEAMKDSGELRVEYFTKEDFQKQIHDLQVSASVKLKLAVDLPGILKSIFWSRLRIPLG